jgi:hypothetical protein
MRLDIENRLTYKSELLAMTQCTEKFLNSKDIADILMYWLLWGMLPNHIVPITMKTILY